MFVYKIRVALSSGVAINPELRDAIKAAAHRANTSYSAVRKGRIWSVSDEAADSGTVVVLLRAKSRVKSPTRSLSAVSRELVADETLGADIAVHGRVFDSEVISVECVGDRGLTQPEIMKAVIEILFETNIDPHVQRLANEAGREVVAAVTSYVEGKKAMEGRARESSQPPTSPVRRGLSAND